MAIPANDNRSEFHRVVLAAQGRRGQKKAQDLWIGLGGPPCEEVKHKKNQHTAKQAVEQVERARPEAHGEKEELSLGPENREGPGE